MKKRIIFCLLSVLLLLSGCQQTNINELREIVESNPEEYFGEWDELQYISSEYDKEKEVYHLHYQKKVEKNYIVRTYNATAHFFMSNDEWVFHDADTELANTYLNIAETTWETTPREIWSDSLDDYFLAEGMIKILDVSEDGEQISLIYGDKTIQFTRKHTESDNIAFVYVSENSSEPMLLSYNVAPSGTIRILFYFGYKVTSSWGEMPDLEYTMVQ